jgi:polysaccharide biosynthesis/export protein
MQIMRYFLITLTSLVMFSSCKIFRSNLMLKTPKDFVYDKLIDSLSRSDYKIGTNDALIFRVYTNNGFKLLDITNNTNNVLRTEVDVVVQSDGYAKLPLLGSILLKGLTIKEIETLMEEKYSKYYIDPYVNLRVSNKRVIIFPGNGGSAKVLPITNNNTTILESVANAGGILDDGKAYKVKLIRSNPDPKQKPFVYLMDLSDITGIKDGQSIVQAGDIIYVEPRYRPLSTFNREITPLVSLLTSVLILYQFSRIAR